MNLAVVASLAAALVAALAASAGGVAAYLGQRRGTTGRVDTSDASVLWQQSQELIKTLGLEKGKAEEQRDRLIDTMTNQIHPALEAISTSQVQMLEMMKDMVARVNTHEVQIQASNGGSH